MQQSPLRKFYATDLTPCPYLPGRSERRLVTLIDPEATDDGLDLFTETGFRRSQRFLYRPACPGCSACVPVRIVVAGFRPGRTFRRIAQRNASLVATELPPVATDEQYALFHRYLRARHGDGGMVRMSRADYGEMVEQAARGTRLVEFREPDGTLTAVSLTDFLGSGLSGVYKFFEPEDAGRSLGTYAILWHIQRARELGLPYVYLGYWIAGSRKMVYKARFKPLERLDGWSWQPLVPEQPAREPCADGTA
ncbi:arginyltransferase [Marinimicrococcus flavescens]|uniref:Aspartate/glutamate leucyltransferase n=1 Tax=Marinimicrococcus flavescens TaxID=3031815 RepID=A0AAP4D5X2_9PROT|nr:arginyltransferase [Marinimicrococcus flavescens]